MRGCKRNTGNIWCETTVFACKLLAHPMTTDLPRRRATEGVDSALLALVSAANRQMARSVCQLLIRPLWKHQISSLKLLIAMEEGVLEVRNSPHVRQFSTKELHEATAGFAKKLGRYNGMVYVRTLMELACSEENGQGRLCREPGAESGAVPQHRCFDWLRRPASQTVQRKAFDLARPSRLFWHLGLCSLLLLSLYACFCERNWHMFSTNVLSNLFWVPKPYFRTPLEIYSPIYLICVSQRLHYCHDSASTYVLYAHQCMLRGIYLLSTIFSLQHYIGE